MRRTLQQLVDIIKGPNPKKFYKTIEWQEVRVTALERDHYNCKRCSGEWDSSFDIKRVTYKDAKYVHHIKSLKDYPNLCIDLNNLVSLCFMCHEVVEERNKKFESKVPLTIERW